MSGGVLSCHRIGYGIQPWTESKPLLKAGDITGICYIYKANCVL